MILKQILDDDHPETIFQIPYGGTLQEDQEAQMLPSLSNNYPVPRIGCSFGTAGFSKQFFVSILFGLLPVSRNRYW